MNFGNDHTSVVDIAYDGNERRGLTAKCRRTDDSEHVIAASDVVFPQGSIGARYVSAYRNWLSLDPYLLGHRDIHAEKECHEPKKAKANRSARAGH